jgi:hypothetical protein
MFRDEKRQPGWSRVKSSRRQTWVVLHLVREGLGCMEK